MISCQRRIWLRLYCCLALLLARILKKEVTQDLPGANSSPQSSEVFMYVFYLRDRSTDGGRCPEYAIVQVSEREHYAAYLFRHWNYVDYLAIRFGGKAAAA